MPIKPGHIEIMKPLVEPAIQTFPSTVASRHPASVWVQVKNRLLGIVYCVVAGALDVNLVFAAFLAAFAVVHKKRRLFADALEAIGKVSFAFFIPVYFAIVGSKLDLVKAFSWRLLLLFLVGTCIVKILSVFLAGRFAGFRGLDLVNLALTTNALVVRASSSRFRRGHHQCEVLHCLGACGRNHVAIRGCLVGICTPSWLATA